MKFIQSSRVRILASTLLCLFAFGSASFAGTLSYPRGLAVDSKGNLYVANSGANNIVVYGPKYAQQTAKTITSNISNPTAGVRCRGQSVGRQLRYQQWRAEW